MHNGKMRIKVIFMLLLTVFILLVIIITVNKKREKACAALGGAYNSGSVVIIDAGHGGMDGGATGVSGLLEKDCTLIISKKLDAAMAFLGIKTIMIRTEDMSLDYSEDNTIRKNKIADLKARLKIADETENPVFFSIHLNIFPESQYRGAQVFYGPNSEKSAELADITQKTLISLLNDGNTRKYKKAPDSVYLMNKLSCPAVTIECGFVSNPEEEALLKNEGYQKKLAIAIAGGFIKYITGK
ncbi:MAG: N-acetylmuramoyl-L-alanine amidase [Bacillota bacterium]|nr:N-acetylmuramoyl-L-alanine amidase [Bacillota bacterium]